MKNIISLSILLAFSINSAQADETKKYRSTNSIITEAKDDSWRPVKQENLLYMKLPHGLVLFELAPDFAPEHVQQIKHLAKNKFWDGSNIYRVQDNYVVQFGDPHAEDENKKKALPEGTKALPVEFERSLENLEFTAIPDKDSWASKVGFSNGFPVASDENNAWLTHCYGILGAGRNNAPDSSNGAELYVVIGQSPRQLDRNITLVGRVLQGIEYLSALPRGMGNDNGYIGFYKPEQYIDISSIHLGSEIPENERINIEVMKTDSQDFADVVESRRNRGGNWFVRATGNIDICNIEVPVRIK